MALIWTTFIAIFYTAESSSRKCIGRWVVVYSGDATLVGVTVWMTGCSLKTVPCGELMWTDGIVGCWVAKRLASPHLVFTFFLFFCNLDSETRRPNATKFRMVIDSFSSFELLIHWHRIPLKILRTKNAQNLALLLHYLTLCARSFVRRQIFRKQTTFGQSSMFSLPITPISTTFIAKFLVQIYAAYDVCSSPLCKAVPSANENERTALWALQW